MYKCMIIKHLMHEKFHKNQKNQINDQKSISSTISTTIRTLPHPNGMIVQNECLMRSETRVGRMKTKDAYKQEGKNIKNFFQQLTIFPKIWFCFYNTTFKKLKFLFSFNSFKSLKFRTKMFQITKDTTMVTTNGFRYTKLFREGSSNMVLFSLQHRTLRSYVTDHIIMVASRNKLRSTQFPKMRPK